MQKGMAAQMQRAVRGNGRESEGAGAMKPYYEHAGITIYHGDCREILPSLPKVDAVITDPPYGAGYAANPIVGKGKTQSNHQAQVWDNMPFPEIDLLIAAAPRVAIWGGNYYALP